eukprot:5958415-Pyramimonas_sp.AAC.1
MQWAIVFGKLGNNFETVTKELLHLTKAFFRGFAQTRIVELANKYLRDCEIRDNCSRTMKDFTLWELPVKQRLIQDNERVEIQTTTTCSPPPHQDLVKLFHAQPAIQKAKTGAGPRELASVDLRNEWSSKLKGVTNRRDWESPDD